MGTARIAGSSTSADFTTSGRGRPLGAIPISALTPNAVRVNLHEPSRNGGPWRPVEEAHLMDACGQVRWGGMRVMPLFPASEICHCCPSSHGQ